MYYDNGRFSSSTLRNQIERISTVFFDGRGVIVENVEDDYIPDIDIDFPVPNVVLILERGDSCVRIGLCVIDDVFFNIIAVQHNLENKHTIIEREVYVCQDELKFTLNSSVENLLRQQ